MNVSDILFNTYLLILTISILVGLYRFSLASTSIKIVVILLIITVISEGITRYMSKLGMNRNPIYHFYSIISFFVTAMYFVRIFKLKKEAGYIALLTIILPVIGLINCMFLQPITVFNSNILILKSLTIIALSLYSLFRILLDDSIHDVYTYCHFWLSGLFLLLYSGSFFFWATFNVLKQSNYLWRIQYVQAVYNALIYAGLGTILYLYPRIKTNER